MINNSQKLSRIIRIPVPSSNESINQSDSVKNKEKIQNSTSVATAPVTKQNAPQSVISKALAEAFDANVDVSRATYKQGVFDRDLEAFAPQKTAKTTTPPVSANILDTEVLQAALIENLSIPVGQENSVGEGFYLDDGFGRETEKQLFALEKTAQFNADAPVGHRPIWG